MHKTSGKCGELACILEVTARKAGNVHPGQSFADLTHLDFLASARAIVPALDAELPPGEMVLQAMRATRDVVSTNTNLGILLLLAPLAVATRTGLSRANLEAVLLATTIDDSAAVFRAIRLANPGGLGQSAEEDVHTVPTQPLRSIMKLAASRDLIARQYANGFAELWDVGLPALTESYRKAGNLERAIVECQLRLMAAVADTLILRKAGAKESDRSRELALEVLEAGWPQTDRSRVLFRELDDWLRADGNRRNPGATADLVTACLFVGLWQNTIPWLDQLEPFGGLDYA
jgi:triphosphoribosyl-dephospho-CoA synthase